MKIVARVAAAMQSLLGTEAEQLAKTSSVIRRRRKFTAVTLARTFILGFLQKPNASAEDLAQIAALSGVCVTPQAIDQRLTPALAGFLESLWQAAVAKMLSADAALVPLLRRFSGVFLLDSTIIPLPASVRERFAGCGGGRGGGEAALKLQVLWDLLGGGLRQVIAEAGRACDATSSVQETPLPAGSLRIADLGYFSIPVLTRLASDGVFWISRIQFGTAVFAPDGTRCHLVRWLPERWRNTTVEAPIFLGACERLPCRLLAWKVPEEVANRRRHKLLVAARRKGRTPSSDRLLWCDWTVLVTNAPAERLAWNEAVALYRARWQIELLFKLWKSYGRVDELDGSTPERQLVRFWSRLLAVTMQHWLLLCGSWEDARRSVVKSARAARDFSRILVLGLKRPRTLPGLLEDFRRSLAAAARQNPRRRTPGTWQLLLNPQLLNYRLT